MEFIPTIMQTVSSVGAVAGEYLPTILQTAGAAGTVIGAINQASNAEAAAKYEARAQRAIGRENLAATRRRAAGVMAKNAARAAAGGVDPFSGSPLELELENAFNVGKEMSLIKYDTKLKQERARQYGQQGVNQATGSFLGGLSDFGSVLGKGYQLWKTNHP